MATMEPEQIKTTFEDFTVKGYYKPDIFNAGLDPSKLKQIVDKQFIYEMWLAEEIAAGRIHKIIFPFPNHKKIS